LKHDDDTRTTDQESNLECTTLVGVENINLLQVALDHAGDHIEKAKKHHLDGVYKRQRNIVFELLAVGVVFPLYHSGITKLIECASYFGLTGDVTGFIAATKLAIDSTDWPQDTQAWLGCALHLAVSQGHIDVVSLLLSNGVYVTSEIPVLFRAKDERSHGDKLRYTAVQYAIR
jgi:ankyrin repeat protein